MLMFMVPAAPLDKTKAPSGYGRRCIYSVLDLPNQNDLAGLNKDQKLE